MKCPNCNESRLVMTDRQGIEIDYCPECRGIWLDRGELDKLLERASVSSAKPPSLAPQSRAQPDFEDSDYRRRTSYGGERKKSWLNEIFD